MESYSSPHSSSKARAGVLAIVSIVYLSVAAGMLAPLLVSLIADLEIPLSIAVVIVVGFVLTVIALGKPVLGLGLLVIPATTISVSTLLSDRLFVAGIPLNILDLVALLALALLLMLKLGNRVARRIWRTDYFLQYLMIAAILILVLSASAGVVAGNSVYDMVRFVRSVLLLVLAFLLTTYVIRGDGDLQWAFRLVVFGGVLDTLRFLVFSFPLFGTASSIYEVRHAVSGALSSRFVLIIPLAFVLSKHYILRSKLITWFLVFTGLAIPLLSFTLTSYVYFFLIPAAAIAITPGLRFHKRLMLISLFGLPLACSYLMVSFSNVLGLSAVSNIVQLIGETKDVLSLGTKAPQVAGRVFMWQKVIETLGGPQIMFGKGLGFVELVDTGIPGVGTQLLGEPAYTTYLLNTGLLGLSLLIALQLRFVFLAYSNSRFAGSPYTRGISLAITLYGIITITDSILHNNFLAPQVSILYGVLLGLVEVIHHDSIQRRSERYQPRAV